MEADIQDEVFSFKQDLIGSRNYYGALWDRYRFLNRAIMILDALAAILVVSDCVNLNLLLPRAILLTGLCVSAFKQTNDIVRRAKDLEFQFHECQDILNCLDREKEIDFNLVSQLRERFAKVEKKDKPTIECLMAVCRNKALVSLGVKQQFKMTRFERWVGIYFTCIKFDDHAELVDRV